jgi:hypothetical protein
MGTVAAQRGSLAKELPVGAALNVCAAQAKHAPLNAENTPQTGGGQTSIFARFGPQNGQISMFGICGVSNFPNHDPEKEGFFRHFPKKMKNLRGHFGVVILKFFLLVRSRKLKKSTKFPSRVGPEITIFGTHQKF